MPANKHHSYYHSRLAFTLAEVLVVVSIIAVLAALAFPVFSSSRGSALRIACQGNLHNIGLAFQLYASSYDDTYPAAIDRHDRDYPENIPLPHPPVAEIPDITDVIRPYAGHDANVFRCPRDIVPFQATANEVVTGSYPSYFDYAESSYLFLAWGHFGRSTTNSLRPPSELWLCQDALDVWHNEFDEYSPFASTRNSLYGDGHVKFGPARG